MESKNKELFEELDGIVEKLFSKYNNDFEKIIALNEELGEYIDDYNNSEAEDIPNELFIEKYDNAETLNNLINIAKGL